jgi:hypothetical protein
MLKNPRCHAQISLIEYHVLTYLRSHRQTSIFVRQQNHDLAFEGFRNLFGSIAKKLFQVPGGHQVTTEGIKLHAAHPAASRRGMRGPPHEADTISI